MSVTIQVAAERTKGSRKRLVNGIHRSANTHITDADVEDLYQRVVHNCAPYETTITGFKITGEVSRNTGLGTTKDKAEISVPTHALRGAIQTVVDQCNTRVTELTTNEVGTSVYDIQTLAKVYAANNEANKQVRISVDDIQKFSATSHVNASDLSTFINILTRILKLHGMNSIIWVPSDKYLPLVVKVFYELYLH